MQKESVCMFEESGIVAAVESAGAETIEKITNMEEMITENFCTIDPHLLMKALETISEQLQEQTNLLKMIVEFHEQR